MDSMRGKTAAAVRSRASYTRRTRTMARVSSGLPTYEFASDPLPPRTNGHRGQADLNPGSFQPMMTVRLGDREFNVTERVDGSTPWRKTGNTDFDHFLGAISRSHSPGGQS